jgi:hypothetical protein
MSELIERWWLIPFGYLSTLINICVLKIYVRPIFAGPGRTANVICFLVSAIMLDASSLLSESTGNSHGCLPSESSPIVPRGLSCPLGSAPNLPWQRGAQLSAELNVERVLSGLVKKSVDWTSFCQHQTWLTVKIAQAGCEACKCESAYSTSRIFGGVVNC